MKTPTDILRIASTRRCEDALLAFKILNATYTEEEVIKFVRSKKATMRESNIFSGRIFLFYNKPELPGEHVGYIIMGEWEKYYIVITSEKCFLKMKTDFNEEWKDTTQRTWKGLLEYIDYK